MRDPSCRTILSYNSNGTLLWSKVVGTSAADYGFAVASGADSFYAGVNLGADIGPSVEGGTPPGRHPLRRAWS